MDVKEAIRARRSVREFKPDTVPQGLLQEIIEAATWAPSAVNEQPWLFTVVQDQHMLDRISRDAKSHMLKVMMTELAAHLLERLRDPAFHIFYHAPALIVISARGSGPWAVEDCALAADNLMLASRAKGLGTCWIGFAQRWLGTPEGKQLLELPADCLPVAPIIVGYPRAMPPAPHRHVPQVHWMPQAIR